MMIQNVFANIDCFDIEVKEDNPQKLADIVASLEPTFGAINLEDIKAPDCFEVERLCKEKIWDKSYREAIFVIFGNILMHVFTDAKDAPTKLQSWGVLSISRRYA